MQIKITYDKLIPRLLFDELRDFVKKQGMVTGESVLETYSKPDDSSSFIYRGTMTFTADEGNDKKGKEGLRANIVGSDKSETKLLLDIDEKVFPKEKTDALLEDLDFVFSSYKTG